MSNLSTLLKTRGLRLADLARRMNVHKATVTRWAQTEVPVERVADVERETGIPSQELRPDLAAVFAAPQPQGAGQ